MSLKPFLVEYTVTYRNSALVFAEDAESAEQTGFDIYCNCIFDPEYEGYDGCVLTSSPATEKQRKDFQRDAFMDAEKLSDEDLEQLWEELADVPMIPNYECIEEPFLIFPRGTERDKIWHWFDEHHSKGVHWLLYEREG